MTIHQINIQSKSDCEELVNRISQTLSDVNPSVLAHINHYPQRFVRDDAYIFEWLTPAILSTGTKYCLLEPHLATIKRVLLNYDIAQVAGLADSDIIALYLNHIEPLRIPSRPLPRGQPPWTRLIWIRDNAKRFQEMQRRYGSVWHFIETNLGGTRLSHAHGCYIHPNDGYLLKCFSQGPFKLGGVGYAICCEFFKNIGVDEFKPDTHTISFLNRISLDRRSVNCSTKPHDVRSIGIAIAQTLGVARAYVDSHIWVFCAEGEGEICTEDDLRCGSCRLKGNDPMFCKGFPSKADIITNPVEAARRFRECNVIWKDAGRKMERAGLTRPNVEKIITMVY